MKTSFLWGALAALLFSCAKNSTVLEPPMARPSADTPLPPPPPALPPLEEALRAAPAEPLELQSTKVTPKWRDTLEVQGSEPRLLLQRGADSFKAGAISPNGALAVTIDGEAVATLWATETGEDLRRFALGNRDGQCSSYGRSRRPELLRFVSDTQFVVGINDGNNHSSIEAWDVLSGKRIWEEKGELVSVSGNMGLFDKDRTSNMDLFLLDVSTGKRGPELEIGEYRRLYLIDGGQRMLGLSPYIYSGPDKRLHLLDERGRLLRAFPDNREWTDAVMSPSGRLLLASNRDHGFSLFEVATGKLRAEWDLADAPWGHPYGFSQDEAVVVYGGNQKLYVRRLRDKKVLFESEGRLPSVHKDTLIFQRDQDWVPHEVQVDLREGSVISDRPADEPGPTPVVGFESRKIGEETRGFVRMRDGTEVELRGITRPISEAHSSSGTRLLLSLNRERSSMIGGSRPHYDRFVFDLMSGEPVARLSESSAPYATFSMDGQSFVDGGKLKLASREEPIGAFTSQPLALGPRQQWLLTGDSLLTLEKEGYRALPLTSAPDDARSLRGAGTPDGRLVAISGTVYGNMGARAGMLGVWDGLTGDALFVSGASQGRFGLDSAFGDVNAISFSPDGEHLAVAEGYSCRASLVDPKTGRVQSRLRHRDNVQDVQWSPDGKLLVTASGGFTDDNLVRVFRGERVLHEFEHDDMVHTAGFLAGSNFVVSASRDHTLRIWDLSKQTEAARLVFLDEDHWVAVDPKGRFDASDLERLADVRWTRPDFPLSTLPIESFQRDYFTPGLIAKILSRSKMDSVPDLTTLDVQQPQLSFAKVQSGPAGLKVVVDVRSPHETEAPQDLRLFLDGQLVGRQPKLLPGGSRVTFDKIPHGSRGAVQLSAYVFNHDGVKSKTVFHELEVSEQPQQKRRAFVINVGVNDYPGTNLDLSFAVADAKLLADKLSKSFSETYDVHSVLLTSRRGEPTTAAKAHLQAVLRVLSGDTSIPPELVGSISGASELSAAQADDLLIVTFSGHGLSERDGEFLLLLSDFPGITRAKSSKGTMSDLELSLEFQGIAARQTVLIIDACQSAAAVESGGFKPGPLGARGLGQIAYDKKMIVLAASQADNFALEDARIGHGLLTYALAVDGWDRESADFAPKDGKVLLSEWLDYGAQRVPYLVDLLHNGRAASRGLVLVGSPRDAGVAQQPRVFDFSGNGLDVILHTTSARSGAESKPVPKLPSAASSSPQTNLGGSLNL